MKELVKFVLYSRPNVPHGSVDVSERRKVLDRSQLSPRARNVLANAGCYSAEEAAQKLTRRSLEQQPLCGTKTLNDIVAWLESQGYGLVETETVPQKIARLKQRQESLLKQLENTQAELYRLQEEAKTK